MKLFVLVSKFHYQFRTISLIRNKNHENRKLHTEQAQASITDMNEVGESSKMADISVFLLQKEL
jgi:hypothetical protein